MLYERLAQVTAWQSDVDARWLALVGLEALGHAVGRSAPGAGAGPRRSSPAPQRVRLDDAARAVLRGGSLGALAELWRAIAPAVQVATGVDPAKLGFSRGDRSPLKKLGDKYEPLATALACFGVDDVELYISAGARRASRARSPPRPRSCASARTSPRRPSRSSAGCSAARSPRSPRASRRSRRCARASSGWTIAAALRAIDLAIPPGLPNEIAGEDASIAERAKILKKEM